MLIDEEDQDEPLDEELLQAMRSAVQQQSQADPTVSRWTSGLGAIGKAMQQGQLPSMPTQGGPASAASGSMRLKNETKKLLGAPTLFKQLEMLFTEMERIASKDEAPSSGLSSPLAESPKRRVSLFGGKKGEKKRLIEKYKAQVQALEANRKVLAEKLHKAGQTGDVTLGMLKQEWTTVQLELARKNRELEKAQEQLGGLEAETTQLRTALAGLRKQLAESAARPLPPIAVRSPPAPVVVASPEGSTALSTTTAGISSQELVVKEARLSALETELDLAYGKLEAFSMQQNLTQDRSSGLVQQLQMELREVKGQLAARVKKYTELKERVRQLEEELEASAGQIEAVKHQMELRAAKIEDRLKESMREALENERTAKNALFKRQQAEEEMDRLQEQYDALVGQFEAIRSQVELEKMEAQGTVAKYEQELEDVYGKLNAKDEYAGLLCGVKKDMDGEMTDLWTQLEEAEEKRAKMEAAFVTLGTKYRQAATRRVFNFMVEQQKRTLREAFLTMKKNAKATPIWEMDA